MIRRARAGIEAPEGCESQGGGDQEEKVRGRRDERPKPDSVEVGGTIAVPNGLG